MSETKNKQLFDTLKTKLTDSLDNNGSGIGNKALFYILKSGIMAPLAIKNLSYIVFFQLVFCFYLYKIIYLQDYFNDQGYPVSEIGHAIFLMMIPYTILLLIALLLMLAKGIDLLTQSAYYGGEDKPSLNPFSHASPFLIIKFVLFLIMPLASFLLLWLFMYLPFSATLKFKLFIYLSMVISYAVIAYYIVVFFVSPTFLMMLAEGERFIRFFSIPRHIELGQKIGVNAYVLLLALAILPTLSTKIIEIIFSNVNVDIWLYLIITVIISFISYYLLYVLFFTAGKVLYFVRESEEDSILHIDFTPKIKSYEQGFKDAKAIYKGGHLETAALMLEVLLKDKEIPFQNRIEITQFVVMILEEGQRNVEADKFKQEILSEMIRVNPYQVEMLANLLSEQIDQGFIIPMKNIKPIAKIAYQKKLYYLVMQISEQLTQEYPDHKDFAEMKLLYVDCLLKENGSLEKALKIIDDLLQQYPDSHFVPKFKKYLAHINYKILEKQQEEDEIDD